MQTTINNQYENKVHELILKICHQIELPLHFNVKGPKTFTNNQRVALLILKQRLNMSFKRLSEFLHETKWPKWLGLKEIPRKSTLFDWSKLFKMGFIREFFDLLLIKEQPKVMAIDGTGLDAYHRSRHYEWRLQLKKTPHVKLDILIDVETKLIHDFSLKMRQRHDILFAKSMAKRNKHKNVLILADGAYDCEYLHRLLAKQNNQLYAPVRKSSRNVPKGWYRKKCVEKHPLAGKRSIVESTFHAIKKRFGPLRAKHHFMKKREMAWKLLSYNLEKLAKAVAYFWLLLRSYSGCARSLLKLKKKN